MNDLESSGSRLLSKVGGIAGALAAAVLLGGIGGLVGVPALRNWLALLFAINAGAAGASLESMGDFNPVDIAVLVLAGTTFLGYWPGPGSPRKVWTGLAITLPFAGIAVLLATGLWGRSGLMGGGLVLSFLMLGDRASRVLASMGVAANSLLLVGDFMTGGTRVPIVAAIIAVGYVLLMVWFLWNASRLLAAGREHAEPGARR